MLQLWSVVAVIMNGMAVGAAPAGPPPPPRIDRAQLTPLESARLARLEQRLDRGGSLYLLADDNGHLACVPWKVTPGQGAWEFELSRKYRDGGTQVSIGYSGAWDAQDVTVVFRMHEESRNRRNGMGEGSVGTCRTVLEVDPRGAQLTVDGGAWYLDRGECQNAAAREKARRAQDEDARPPAPSPSPLSPTIDC